MWLRVDPGQYIIICWNKGHDKTTPVHTFTVQEIGAADDRPPKEDVVLKLFDYRFELDRALRKGVQVIRVETPGPAQRLGPPRCTSWRRKMSTSCMAGPGVSTRMTWTPLRNARSSSNR